MEYRNEALTAARMLMADDVVHAQRHYDANPKGQPERRSLIRAEFAFIEAWIYSCRYLSVMGDRSKIPTKVPATQNVEDSLTELSSILESSPVIDKQDAGWCSMKQAYRIRDRITHPKSRDDIGITDGDMNVFGRAVKWFAETAEKIERQRKTIPSSA